MVHYQQKTMDNNTAMQPTEEKFEKQQDGRFSFTEIYHYIKEGKHLNSFSKPDKQALRKRAKFFIIKHMQLYYIGGGKLDYNTICQFT